MKDSSGALTVSGPVAAPVKEAGNSEGLGPQESTDDEMFHDAVEPDPLMVGGMRRAQASWVVIGSDPRLAVGDT